MIPDAMPHLADLGEMVERLPAHSPLAMRVLQVANDDRADAAILGEAVEADPAISTRVLRLANSTYYGVSGRVGGAAAAVRVVGFSTVRSLAATVAAGLHGPGRLPEGYWEHAALVASAASLLARRAGVPRGDAFSLGLLHDLGRAVLVRSPFAESVPVGVHPELAAALLRSWQFPSAMCDAIAGHHRPASAASPHERALVAALAVARLAVPGLDEVDDDEQQAGCAALGLGDVELDGLVDQVAAMAGAVAAAFT